MVKMGGGRSEDTDEPMGVWRKDINRPAGLLFFLVLRLFFFGCIIFSFYFGLVWPPFVHNEISLFSFVSFHHFRLHSLHCILRIIQCVCVYVGILLFLHFAKCRWEIRVKKNKTKNRKNLQGSNGNDGVEVVLLIRTRALSYIFFHPNIFHSYIYTHEPLKDLGSHYYSNPRQFILRSVLHSFQNSICIRITQKGE